MEKLNNSYCNATATTETTRREILEAMQTFMFSMIVDDIIQEEVILRILKTGRVAPFSFICENAKLSYFSLEQYCGKWLDTNGIIASFNFARDFFDQEIYNLFAEFNKIKSNFDDNAQYSGKFKQEIENVYMFFTAILQEKVQYDSFSLIPEQILSMEAQQNDERRIHCFVFDMFHGKFRRGACVHKYIAKLNYVPFYIKDLLKLVKGKYYVKVDRDSAFMYCALLALFLFKIPEDGELFLRKLKQFEKVNESLFN